MHECSQCKLPFSRDSFFLPKFLHWACSQWWLSFLFKNCTTVQGALQFPSQQASQSASLITLGFHTLPDHNTYLPSTSPQLRCLQLEMTITCSVIVGCLFFLSPPTSFLGDTLLVGRAKGNNVLSRQIKMLQSFKCKGIKYKIFSFFLFLFLLFHYLSIISVCTTCLLPLCILSFFASLLFPPPRATPA